MGKWNRRDFLKTTCCSAAAGFAAASFSRFGLVNALAQNVPWLIGGSADLTTSNNTELKGKGTASAAEPAGRNIHFGVREHAMGAVLNAYTSHDLVAFHITVRASRALIPKMAARRFPPRPRPRSCE